ncbi:MAG: rod shape-determining protein MreC [Deltaproteobacteria bacterium]|nr:rod shape-determining protein MreC [Deltaproteobacteria bacterium]MBW2052016.1 rod shape-determining protein MreC [Deltaproteobacteria bacterium]MBW2139954.1 rod shape-determining protein MreC [Deltaproteobacteria bacterium]
MLRYWRPILLAVFFIIFIVIFVRWTGGQKEAFNPAGFSMEVVASFQNIVTGSALAIENFWRGYFYLVNTQEENKTLRKTLAQFRATNNGLREASLANERLKKLLNFQTSHDLPVIGGQVVAYDPKAWFKTIVINRGKADGLRISMPVVADGGAVGRIVELTAHYARVLLLIDYNSSIDTLVQRTRVRGVLSGKSAQTCELKYVLKHDDLVRGDVLVTSGLGGVFPKGLKLGKVARVRKINHDLFLEVEAAPAVDFDKLEEVLVILKEDSLL